MKSKTAKLKLKKEVIARLSNTSIRGGGLSDHCEEEPFTTELGYCKETFGTECLCGTDDCTATSLGEVALESHRPKVACSQTIAVPELVYV